MALDGGFLHCLTEELNTAIGCKVDKIYQPSKDELVFSLRSKDFNGRLFISANPSCARLHFTQKPIENPAQPPMLCMLLRKHLTGARLISASQYDLDRVCILEFEGLNELGDTTHPRLIVELMGGQSNAILVADNGRIIDAVRRSDLEKGGRVIQPGAIYQFPEKQQKLNPLESSHLQIVLAIDQTLPIDKAVFAAVQGISPFVCRELALCPTADEAVAKLLCALKSGKAHAAVDKDDNIIEFSYMPIAQYGDAATTRCYDSFSAMLDEIYANRDAKNRISTQAQQLSKLLSAAKGRILRKLDYRRQDLARCAGKEDLRIKGELLKANLHLVQPWAKSVRVQNYYDPELKEITIQLKEELSPAANASLLFKEYKKKCNAERLLDELITIGTAELEYVESVSDALERAESTSDLNEIKAELESTGYIRQHSKAKKNTAPLRPREYISPDGFKILAGRNNVQNDQLTFKLAQKHDVWLHVKDFPGSHVIIITNGAELPDTTLVYAAKVAAANSSKVSASASVPVDYTLVKRVKKQPGGKPGMVTYTEQKTLYVTPEKDM